MRTTSKHSTGGQIKLWLLPIVWSLLAPGETTMAGNWVALANKPTGNVNLMLLLPNGTVIAANFPGGTNIGNAWYSLTPDASGSYVKGNWTNIASMVSTRRFFSSIVLRDGRVLVAGAEYGTGWNTAEVYDYVADKWTPVPVPYGLLQTNNNPQPPQFANTAGFTDSAAKILPYGTVLVAPNNPTTNNQTLIFNPYTMSWSAGPTTVGNQNEGSWVKLPDDSILAIDKNTQNSERYIPSLNTWIADNNVPVYLFDFVSELGAALMMQNGKALFIGANGSTAIYTPSGNTNLGSWVQGPPIPAGLGAHDAPAAMMSNGRILCVAGSNLTNAPASFYEYTPLANSFAAIAGPPSGTVTNTPSFQIMLLDLPDGNVLFANETSNQLYVYQPDPPTLAAGKPTITSITVNGDGSFHLTGTQLNGISEGAAYGDDAQMDSNYPLVRVGDGSGNLIYLPTYNWSSTSISPGNKPVSTEFFAFQSLTPALAYSLVTVANGISSDPVTFYGPVWVDFNSSSSTEDGTYDSPYKTLAAGVNAVPSGGTINIKPGLSHETMTISKPMTLVAIGGAARIGQ